MASDGRILVLEDSREDRFRYRQLFRHAGLTDKGDDPHFQFAWSWGDASSNGRPKVVWPDTILKPDPISEDGSFKSNVAASTSTPSHNFRYFFIDLAWTKSSETLMRHLQLLTPGAVDELIAGQQIKVTRDLKVSLEEILENVEGLKILRWLKDQAEHKNMAKLYAYIASAYLPSASRGLQNLILSQFRSNDQIELQMFHKWIDESPLASRISEISGLMR